MPGLFPIKYLAAATLALLLAADSSAMQQHIRFERISVEQGLSHPNVTAILQDQSGFMWIGTVDGLNRYDGHEFVIYRHDAQNPNSLSDNEIRAIVEDDFGNLWVGTRAGLDRLNRGTNTFTRFSHDSTNVYSLSDNDITALLVDHESALWVGTRNGGLNRFNRSTDSFDRFQHDPKDLPHTIAEGPIASIYEDRHNNLWIATRAHNFGALDQFDRATETFVHTYGCPDSSHGDCNIEQTGNEHRPIATDINGLFHDSTGAFWLATDSGAIKDFEGWLSPYSYLNDNLKSLSANQVLAPIEDRQGTLWFGTRGGGLNQMGPEKPVTWSATDGRNWYQIPHDPSWHAVFDRHQYDSNDPYSLSSNFLTVLYEDRFGVIWIGTSDAGLNKFDPTSMQFGHYKHDKNNPTSLSDNMIGAIAESFNGTLWFGTRNGVLNKIDRASGKLNQFFHRPGEPDTLPGALIHALYVDANDVLWIGTRAGLSRMDVSTGTFENFNIHPIGPSVLPVLSITEEPAGTLWLGTTASLTKFDTTTEDFKHYWANPADASALHGDYFHVLQPDPDGRIWVGTLTAGLNRFDPESERATHFRHDPNNVKSIGDNYITSLMLEQGSSTTGSGPILWIGNRMGLDRYYEETQSFERTSADIELPGSHIAGIAAGRRSVWITTESSGLARYDPFSGQVEHFDAIDGLQGNRFFYNAILRTSRDEIIVSGINGINVFDPQGLSETNEEPLPALTHLTVDGVSVLLNGTEGDLALPDDSSDISFKFSALNYSNPSRTEYAYMLEGYDEDWTITDASQTTATYYNIRPGEYAFRVMAKLGNGNWGEENASLSFNVMRPMWQSNWAYVSYAIILMLTVYAAMAFRARSLKRHADVLEQHVAERTRQIEQNELLIKHQADHLEELLQVKEKLYANISHEFRTPLTLILGPVERMLRGTKNEQSRGQLTMVRENSQRLLRLVDQLLGLSRLSAEKPATQSPQPLLPVTRTIVESFQPLALEKNIDLGLTDSPDLWVKCGPDAMEQILLNLISNAIKYTQGGGWVNVRIARADTEFVQLTVHDSGIGIDPKDHKAVFERFYRAAENGNSKGNGNGNGNGSDNIPGAGLGLALVKELAETAGGSVGLESRVGLGTKITVLLPRHRIRPSDVQQAKRPTESPQTQLEVAVAAQTPHAAIVSRTNGDARQTMLIVEDNADMQAYLVSLFESVYACDVASDGETGVRQAIERVPDIVLCDVMLPGIDGFEFSKILKDNDATSHIPIVMLTGRGDHDSRLAGLREHVDDYLTKPFDDEELSLRVGNILSARDAMQRRYSRQLFDGSDVSDELGEREKKFLDKLQTVLKENYADAEFRLEHLASAMAMSDRQLQRKLKALVDHSPAEYLRSYRLAMARKKLAEGKQVGLVAEAVGFSSQAYFASCFKSEFGTTPSQFQRSMN